MLNQQESITVLDIVQDCMDRGMVASDYELATIKEILDRITDESGEIKKSVGAKVSIEVHEETANKQLQKDSIYDKHKWFVVSEGCKFE